jgi:DNA-binding IclR family transcriptional regulator
MEREKNTEKTGVQSIERIFSIVEILAAHPRGAALQTVAGESGLAKSTAHRMLSSLVALGYALQDGVTGQYRLTLKMFELSSAVVNEMDVLSTARPYLDRLAARTGEAVHLVIRDGVDVVYLYKAESGGLRIGSRIGLRSPMYCTGVGKAILSTLSAEEVEQVWKQTRRKAATPHTITRLPDLLAQLEQTRRRGWAVDDEENELGVRCVALALPGPGGKAAAAFSVTSLVPNMSEDRMRKLAETALLARQDILRDMGVALH